MVYGLCGREEWCVHDFQRERDHLEDLHIDGRIILKQIFKKQNRRRGLDWIDLAQDRDKWQTLLNMVMNFVVP
jgi:hypothetical protein